jgi:carbonic anhydrase
LVSNVFRLPSVSEGTIFDAQPGTLFTQRNIANQIVPTDVNTLSVMAYGINVLKVRHIIVMGHYGCGGGSWYMQCGIRLIFVKVLPLQLHLVPPASSMPAAALFRSGSSPSASSSRHRAGMGHQMVILLILTASRPEIVELRNRRGNATDFPEPEFGEPGFMALVEENIKAGVQNIAGSAILRNVRERLWAFIPILNRAPALPQALRGTGCRRCRREAR